MKYLYVISVLDVNNRMQSYRIASPTLAKAVTEAQRLAGVNSGVEPSTTQNQGQIDSEVE